MARRRVQITWPRTAAGTLTRRSDRWATKPRGHANPRHRQTLATLVAAEPKRRETFRVSAPRPTACHWHACPSRRKPLRRTQSSVAPCVRPMQSPARAPPLPSAARAKARTHTAIWHAFAPGTTVAQTNCALRDGRQLSPDDSREIRPLVRGTPRRTEHDAQSPLDRERTRTCARDRCRRRRRRALRDEARPCQSYDPPRVMAATTNGRHAPVTAELVYVESTIPEGITVDEWRYAAALAAREVKLANPRPWWRRFA